MAMYVYGTDGRPVGFRFSSFIHDLDGEAVGRVFGTHVHRLDGSYVGELFKDSVVEKPVHSVRRLAPVAQPPAQPSPGTGFRRRGLVDYGFADVFHLLTGGGRFEEPLALAAE
jgi:hypothetical protein